MPRVTVRPKVWLLSHFHVDLNASMIELPSELLLKSDKPCGAQIFFAHISPLNVPAPLTDTDPCGINTNADGRLLALTVRTWVAVLQEAASSPLLATSASLSARGVVLQGNGALVALW